jgi:hypothetical protein
LGSAACGDEGAEGAEGLACKPEREWPSTRADPELVAVMTAPNWTEVPPGTSGQTPLYRIEPTQAIRLATKWYSDADDEPCQVWTYKVWIDGREIPRESNTAANHNLTHYTYEITDDSDTLDFEVTLADWMRKPSGPLTLPMKIEGKENGESAGPPIELHLEVIWHGS